MLPARLEGKACGPCTACCEFPPIRAERLQKPTNVLCPHCDRGQGCMVYEKRPGECAGWYCGWFYVPGLSERWHPTASGVVLRPEALDRNEITVVILHPSAFLLSEEFAGAIGGWVAAGVGVHFERLGPPGHLPAKMAVNALLAPAIASGDLREMHKLFSWAIAYMDTRHEWEPDGIVLESRLDAGG